MPDDPQYPFTCRHCGGVGLAYRRDETMCDACFLGAINSLPVQGVPIRGLPPRTARQRLDRLIYVCRWWGPVHSWRCTYSYDRRDLGRGRAFRNYLEQGFFGAAWRAIRDGR